MEAFRGFSTIYFEEVALNIIDLIDDNDVDLVPEMCVYGLRVFRRLIELENTDLVRKLKHRQ